MMGTSLLSFQHAFSRCCISIVETQGSIIRTVNLELDADSIRRPKIADNLAGSQIDSRFTNLARLETKFERGMTKSFRNVVLPLSISLLGRPERVERAEN